MRNKLIYILLQLLRH